jgi:hypothetical protein
VDVLGVLGAVADGGDGAWLAADRRGDVRTWEPGGLGRGAQLGVEGAVEEDVLDGARGPQRGDQVPGGGPVDLVGQRSAPRVRQCPQPGVAR